MSITINIRVDREVKESAAKVLAKMGMTTSTAVNLLLYQVVQDKKLPFTPQITPPACPKNNKSPRKGK